MLAFGAAIIVQALGGVGPFAENSSIEGVVSLQVFLTALAVPLVLLAALMEEAKRTGEMLSRSERRMEFAAASTETGLWQLDQRKQQFWMTEHCRTMFNLAPETTLTPEAFLRAIHPDDRPRVMKAWSAALTSGGTDESIEFRIQRGADDVRWMVARTYPERDAAGAVARLSGILHDVTRRVIAQQDVERLTQRLLTLQDDERKSIALELHDSTAQHLAACRLHLAALRHRIVPAADLSELIDVIQSSLNQAFSEIRSFTYLLRPPELDGVGLCDALAGYLEGFGRRTGLQVSLDAPQTADFLPADKKHAMYRIVQESLANVHSHAAATRVSVKLRHKAFSLHLFVVDDGCGLGGEATDSPALGVGIPGMAARVRQLGGRFAVRSSSRGTRVHVALPMNLMTFTPELRDAAA
jgi:signal transduction histidine kinase